MNEYLVDWKVNDSPVTINQKLEIDSVLRRVSEASLFKSKIHITVSTQNDYYKMILLIKSGVGNFYADFEDNDFKECVRGVEFEILKCIEEWRGGIWAVKTG